MTEMRDQDQRLRRLDPDPVSVLLAAIGALGSVASLAAYVEFRRDKDRQRSRARRSAIRAISSLREALGEIDRSLSELERLIGRHDETLPPGRGPTLEAPARFGAAPPMFDFFEFSVYQMLSQRVTRAFDRCVADTYEVMDCIEDGAIDVPTEPLSELRDLQHRLNDLKSSERSLAEILAGTRHVAQAMRRIIDDFERHIAFDRAS